MQNDGYTIPELIIVFIVVGLFSIIAINKASYAFVDADTINEKTEEMILIKSATAYANSIKDTLKNEGKKNITGRELVEAKYLVDDDNKLANVKVRLSYITDTDSISVDILK